MIIQIVDDNPNMREAIKSVLGVLTAQFIESGNGADAVKQFEAHKPDFVVMDIRMPGGAHSDDCIDGIAATRAICSVSPNARVIIVTQYDDDDLRAAAKDAGAIQYVLKDDLSDLIDVAARV